GAAIYAGNDLFVGGVSGGKNDAITNQSSTMQAQGNIQLAATTINNVRLGVQVDPGKPVIVHAPRNRHWAIDTTTTTPKFIDEGIASVLLAGGNLEMTGQVTNDTSTMSAGGDLTVNGDMDSHGITLTNTVDVKKLHYSHEHHHHHG